MILTSHEITAGLYLAAGVVAGTGLGLERVQLTRVAMGLLAVGALAHIVSISLLHTANPPPPLTDLSSALSFSAWIGTVAFLGFAWRRRLAGLVVLVAPAAFLGVFAALIELPSPPPPPSTPLGDGSLPHAHVLLASAGLALLGLSGLAGVLFLVEHRRLKGKRRLVASSPWPSLEALDRAGAVSVAAGFPLITLGVLTGALWLRSAVGKPFTGTLHEIGCLIAWAIYVVLVLLRFVVGRPARECAISDVIGFAFLAFAVVGLGLVS